MCTAITYKTKDCYFGRNLDLEYSYNETVTITPKEFSFGFEEDKGYALIGMAYVKDNYPLYYDAINEKGLGMAGLNFPYNAFYKEKSDLKYSIAPYEFIPFILRTCANVKEAKKILNKICLINRDFSAELKSSPLHWIIADSEDCITVESTKVGLQVFDNSFGVLTNNPTFEKQLQNYKKYSHLSATENDYKGDTAYYSRGLGSVGLPGDLSSMSRFVRATFVKKNSVSGCSENESVNQFFHILSSVEMVRGCLKIGDKNDITVYSSCCNLDKGIYYYKTYTNHQICSVKLFNENLNGKELINYPLKIDECIMRQN